MYMRVAEFGIDTGSLAHSFLGECVGSIGPACLENGMISMQLIGCDVRVAEIG